MFQPIRGKGGHLVFPIRPKNTTFVEDIEILLPVKFRWILFSDFREVENVSTNQRPGRPPCFPIGPKNTNLEEDIKILLPVKFRWIPFSGFGEEVEKMSQPIGDQGGHLVFPIGPKNTNLVEDIKILLPVKFRWNLFRGEVENVSANQRPGRPSCFPIGPKKTNLIEDVEVLLPVKFRWNLWKRFQRRSRKCEKLTTDDRRTDDAWSQEWL